MQTPRPQHQQRLSIVQESPLKPGLQTARTNFLGQHQSGANNFPVFKKESDCEVRMVTKRSISWLKHCWARHMAHARGLITESEKGVKKLWGEKNVRDRFRAAKRSVIHRSLKSAIFAQNYFPLLTFNLYPSAPQQKTQKSLRAEIFQQLAKFFGFLHKIWKILFKNATII